jgi:DHA1 family bicyclomycin/chloramphenicol resistance-like MFS transporter
MRNESGRVPVSVTGVNAQSESSTSDYRGRLPLSLVVALLAMLAPFTIDTYLPSFPDIAAELVASPLQMQQTMSLYLLAFALSTLFYGPLSDSFGRKRMAVAALLIYAVSSVGCAVALNIDQLIWMRVGQGIAASAGLVIGRAMIRDCYHGPAAQRVMARMMLIFAVAPAIAPVIGGLLHDAFGWRAVFWFLAMLGLVLATMLLLGSSETHPRERRQSIHPAVVGRAYLSALLSARFMGLAFTFSLIFGGFFLYVAGAPHIIYDHLGLGVNDFWLLFVPLVGGVVGGSFTAGQLAGRLPPTQIVWGAFALMVAAGLLNLLQAFFMQPAPFNVIAPAALYLMGMAIAMPNLSLMGMECFPQNRGMASAMQSFTQMGMASLVVGLIAPWVVPHLPWLALTMVLLNAAALLLWWVVRSREKVTEATL